MDQTPKLVVYPVAPRGIRPRNPLVPKGESVCTNRRNRASSSSGCMGLINLYLHSGGVSYLMELLPSPGRSLSPQRWGTKAAAKAPPEGPCSGGNVLDLRCSQEDGWQGVEIKSVVQGSRDMSSLYSISARIEFSMMISDFGNGFGHRQVCITGA